VRTGPAPGSDPEPGRSSFEREAEVDGPAPSGNEARLEGDVPPHY
jgi:hypothetical protein